MVSEQNFQHLDQPLLFNKVALTWHLLFVSLFSSSKADEGELEENEVVSEECWSRLELSACFLVGFCLFAIKSRSLFTSACATQIIAAVPIWEQRLFRSAHLKMQQQIESGAWSSKYGIYNNLSCRISPLRRQWAFGKILYKLSCLER